jgi:hypothetical protein
VSRFAISTTSPPRAEIRALLVLASGLLACGGLRGDDGPDVSAQIACAQYATLARYVRDGLLTQTEVRSELQDIDRRASASKARAVRDAARDAHAAFKANPDTDLQPAFARLTDACGPSQELSPAEPAGDSAPAVAATEGTPLAVPSDPGAQYFVLERGGTRARPTIVTKRVAAGGASYARREFDCAARTFRYLGDGETREAMDASVPQATFGPLVAGSISDDVGRAACAAKR